MQTNKDFQQHQGLLNGIGQVYFTPSLVTSVLLLFAISMESLPLALLTLLGASSSYTLARGVHTFSHTNSKPNHHINSGMYALNGALIALFIGNFFGVTPLLAVVTIFSALLTVPIANIVFRFNKYRGYTSAFILIAWLIYALQSSLALSVFSPSDSNRIPLMNIDVDSGTLLPTFILTILKGISQVSFINNEWTGLIVLIAITLHSVKYAVWIVLAAVISTLFSDMIGADDTLISQGLYGYNAILATLALVLYPTRVTWQLVIAGMLCSCLITLIFHRLELIPLTAPFVLNTWLMVYLSSRLQKTNVA
ncbi:Eukaryotic-type low-affinity urea transporter [Vibrio chagasii]|nr:Eukaryotic-type low-affinity urea transporter [Vibrio chagasii]CAH7098827.1 Eukaryotic-type low-affinity urea transporter [Vibrio chagasii]CAH7254149.1 Eukaryotic-type low-affinity urea transporter [Vibrio chagasii]CAH7344113.1 Eukaryotic-type low-affinity urea transporter [Vibrio chagasii]